MESGKGPGREGTIEAIVVAFAHSKLQHVVGTDALRSVLTGQRELLRGGILHLQVVWELLEDQPGFDPEAARAPFCLLKKWQSELGLPVELPAALAGSSETEIMAAASHCPVPKAIRDRTLDPVGFRARAEHRRSQLELDAIPAKAADKSPRRQRLIAAALGAVAVGGLSVAAYQLANHVSGAGFQSLPAAEIGDAIPVHSARQLGQEVLAVVHDESWFALPQPAQREALEEALRELKTRDIVSLVVQDETGQVRASAQWVGEPPTILTRLH